MPKKKKITDKKSFTVVLSMATYELLSKAAQAESRPVAQMARLLIDRAVSPATNK
jgi:hypothetical protein